MTIEVSIEVARSARDQGFRYVRAADVAVVSFVGERDSPATSLTAVLHACVDRLLPLLRRWLAALPSQRVYLFTSTPSWGNPNVVARRRGIWGLEEMRWLPQVAMRSPVVEVNDEEGSRFAGMAQIPEEALANAAEFVRTHASAALFCSSRTAMTERGVRAMFALAFPKGESSVDWSSLASDVAGNQDIYLRASGGFDDREVALDALLSSRLLHTLDST